MDEETFKDYMDGSGIFVSGTGNCGDCTPNTPHRSILHGNLVLLCKKL